MIFRNRLEARNCIKLTDRAFSCLPIDGLNQRCCSALLPHKVAAGANSSRIAEEAGTSEDSATVIVTRWAEVYTSIWEYQGLPMDSPLQSWEQEEAELSTYPRVSGWRRQVSHRRTKSSGTLHIKVTRDLEEKKGQG